MSVNEVTTVVLLGSALVAYLLYHYPAAAPRWLARFGESAPRTEQMQARAVFAERWSGGVLLGVLPLLASLALTPLSPAQLGLGVTEPKKALAGLAALLLIALPGVVLSARRPDASEHYPSVRARRWSSRLARANAVAWLGYLLGYEILFRGVLLFGLRAVHGEVVAVAMVTTLYVAVHLPKNARECIATLPMGILFCVASLAAGGFWPSFVAHAVIAVTNDTLVQRQREAKAASTAAPAHASQHAS